MGLRADANRDGSWRADRRRFPFSVPVTGLIYDTCTTITGSERQHLCEVRIMDILLKFPIRVSPEAVFRAITDQEQFRAWWTRDTRFEPRVGSVAEFAFGQMVMKMEIEKLEPPHSMTWRNIGGPPHWPGTRILFEVEAAVPYAMLRFSHVGFEDSVREEVAQTSARWAFYLISLKNYLERGHGQPNPEDVGFWSLTA
jgi:uncharacterized protein YndB with AHSA1/START domain